MIYFKGLKKENILILFSIIFFVNCSDTEMKNVNLKLPLEFKNILTDKMKQIADKKYKLVYFESDGECVGCIAEMKEWFELFEKNKLQSDKLDIYLIFKECNKIQLKYSLKTVGIKKYTYWDQCRVLEKQIDSLSIKHLLLLNANNELVYNTVTKRGGNKEEKIKKIKKIIEK